VNLSFEYFGLTYYLIFDVLPSFSDYYLLTFPITESRL
jgi:hypothetical protein